MAILINQNTRVLIQGITGKSGSLQTKIMLEAGTKIVAGTSPQKSGQFLYDIPIYSSVSEAKLNHEFDTVISFVPPRFALDAAYEAIDAKVHLLVITTEKIPVHDIIKIISYAKLHNTLLLGPGSAGVISPGCSKVGVHPTRFFKPGSIGIVSKSGALSYEIGKTLSESGLGQSSVVAIGGGPYWGFSQKEAIMMFEADKATDEIILLGEIGGTQEEIAAQFIKESVSKPVVSLIVGRHAPVGKSLGHAGAILSENKGTAESKIKALLDAGVRIAKSPKDVVHLINKIRNDKLQKD